jgi:hypothetical protein
MRQEATLERLRGYVLDALRNADGKVSLPIEGK